MRASKTVSLGEGKDAIVHEMRLRDVRAAITAFPADIAGLAMRDLISAHLPDLLNLLKPCIELPDGQELDDLSLSEVRLIGQAFMEVNPDFFVLVEGVIEKFSNTLVQRLITPSEASPLSTPPPVPSSALDTAAPSTTATALP
jgi:hypothetical protein